MIPEERSRRQKLSGVEFLHEKFDVARALTTMFENAADGTQSHVRRENRHAKD